MKADAILNGKVLAMELASIRKRIDAGEIFGQPEPREPQAAMRENDVAVVRVQGMVSHGLTELERWMLDAFDTDEAAAAISEAVADPRVRAVVLDINSPGGMVVGTPELAEAVKAANAEKPVVAFTSSMMASAAYWMGVNAEKVLATASAEVGSIGCYAVHLDLSAAQAMTGIRPVVFRSGDNKAAGVMGTKLSPEQAQDIADGVEAVGADFRRAVKEARASVDESALDGRVFTGAAAVELGLVDGISDLAGAVRAAREAADERERNAMQMEQEVARLQGELDAANGLLAEAANVRTELEAARAELETAKAEAAAARDALAEANAKAEADAATTRAELEAAQKEAAEAKALLAAQPSALRTAGAKPMPGLTKTEEAEAPADWASAVKANGYEKARQKYPELYKAAFGF